MAKRAYILLIGLFFICCLAPITVADTRYECIVNLQGRGGGGDDGGGFEADEFEPEEMGEAEEGGGGMMSATGSLTCPQGNRGHILVKRVAYGTSMFGSTCRSDGYCGEEYDPADSVANRCDGRSSCFIDMLRPVFMKCGRMSTYMLVEYECVDSWTTFDVCATISTVARGASVFMTSPGYLTSTVQKVTTGSQMCECILQSQNGADIYMDYLQTQLASEGDTCPYEYIQIESKKNITSRKIDKELEVCGRRHVGARWFEGSIRLTYASGGQMQKRGLIAKFTADNIGTAPRIELECGPVDASRLTLKERPPAPPTHLPPNSMMPGFPGAIPGMGMGHPMNTQPIGNMGPPMYPGPGMNMVPPMGPPMGMDFSKIMSAFNPGGMFPSLMPGLNMAPSNGPPSAVQPDFSNWKINLPVDTTAAEPKPPANPAPKTAPNKPAGGKGKKGQNQGGRKRGGKQVAGKVIDDRGAADGEQPIDDEEVTVTKKSGNGGMVGLVFGGIGAILILGSVGILALNNYRKRQRIKKEEAEYYYGRSASSVYGHGWKTDDMEDEGSVYATVKDVETYRQGCVNPAVTNDEESTFVNPVVQPHGSGERKGKGKGKKSSVYDEPEIPPTPSCSNEMTSSQQDSMKEEKIAVIEMHRVPEEYTAVTYGNDLHSEVCLSGVGFSDSSKKSDGSENGCSECNIERPTRRQDSDYDNNVSVKRKMR